LQEKEVELEEKKIKEPSAEDFARLTLQDGEMLIKQDLRFAEQVLELPILELEFEGQEILSDELKKLVSETAKERRLMKELYPEVVKSALRRRRQKVGSRLMIKRALANFSSEMQEGLQLDLKTQTPAEIMRKLRLVGADSKNSKRSKNNCKQKLKDKKFVEVDGMRLR
jgi:hypothetical protein